MVGDLGFELDRPEKFRYAFPPHLRREWTRQEIDDELRENGVKLDLEKGGHQLLIYIGCETEMSPKIARGQFVVSEKSSQPNGELMGGVVDYVAESIASAAGVNSCDSGHILGIELNVNHLRPAYIGQELTVIAKPLKHGSSNQMWEIKFETDTVKESTSESNGDPNETVLIATGRCTFVVQTNLGQKKPVVRSKL